MYNISSAYKVKCLQGQGKSKVIEVYARRSVLIKALRPRGQLYLTAPPKDYLRISFKFLLLPRPEKQLIFNPISNPWFQVINNVKMRKEKKNEKESSDGDFYNFGVFNH